MKIQIFSDIHNEFSFFEPSPISADVVVLAGDIDTRARGVKWANEVFSCPVIYVPGNHEFYRGHLFNTLQKMRDLAAPHVHVLEREEFVWKDVRFLGATCWTNFSSTGDVVAATSLARELMNDFRLIRTQDYRRLLPYHVAQINESTRAWLAHQLAIPFEGKTVVVSHHAPVPEVAGDKQEGHLNASYANNWPELVDQADVWIFGHTHQFVDVQLAGCRVVSNPRGYPGEKTGFRSDWTIEL